MASMRLGVVSRLERGPEKALRRVSDLEFPTCQVICWDPGWLNEEAADRLRATAEEKDVEITTIWTGLPGRYVWDFIEGPDTIAPARGSRVAAAARLSVRKEPGDAA